jgi:hypothetical protein
MKTVRRLWTYLTASVFVVIALTVFWMLSPTTTAACGSCGYDQCTYDSTCYDLNACIQIGEKYQHCNAQNDVCSWAAGCPQLGIRGGSH